MIERRSSWHTRLGGQCFLALEQHHEGGLWPEKVGWRQLVCHHADLTEVNVGVAPM